MLQNILFIKDCLSENAPAGSFNERIHPSKLPLNHKIIIYILTKIITLRLKDMATNQ